LVESLRLAQAYCYNVALLEREVALNVLRSTRFRLRRAPQSVGDDRRVGPDAESGDDLMLPRARGQWELVWTRFKRDRVAFACGIFLLLVLVGCFAGEPLAAHLLGHGPNDPFPMSVDADKNLLPAGPWSHVPNIHGVAPVTPDMPRTLFILGADGTLGRDLFLRVLDGGRTSLELALGSTLLALLIGSMLGLVSGYYGGWADAAVSRLTEFIMGFPILLFLIVFGWTVSNRLDQVTLHGTLAPGVVSLLVVIGVFYAFYPARLVRAQVLSLREQEFVEAARMIGASDLRIMRKHLLPHVSGSLIVYGTQLMALTIFLEAALAILGVGIEPGYASWGSIIAAHYGTVFGATGASAAYIDQRLAHAAFLIALWPTLLLFFTVLSVTLFGEGVRNAFDPRAART
jgi:peptide/nickel transport system permease protein